MHHLIQLRGAALLTMSYAALTHYAPSEIDNIYRQVIKALHSVACGYFVAATNPAINPIQLAISSRRFRQAQKRAVQSPGFWVRDVDKQSKRSVSKPDLNHRLTQLKLRYV